MRTARQRTILGRRPAWSSAWWFAPGLALLLVLGSCGDGFAASHSPATIAPSLAPINLNIGFNGAKEPQSADTAIQLLFTLTLERVLIDLPGVDWREAAAVAELGARLNEFPGARAHLVLNAACETPLMLAQIRAFAALAVADVVFTHLDEERRWGKLWNFVLGTDYALRFLSAGQYIPGNFFEGTRNLFWRANSRAPEGAAGPETRARLALAELLLKELGSAMLYDIDDDSWRVAGIFDWSRRGPGPAKRVAGGDLARERCRAGRRNIVALVGEALDQELGASAPPLVGPPESVHTAGMTIA